MNVQQGTPYSDAHIKVDRVSVQFGDRVALDDVSVELFAQRIAIIGANGSGKSTFARLLNGLVQPDSGTVRVHGCDASKDLRKLRQRAGFIFSNPDAQIIMPTVREDVEFTLRQKKLSSDQVRELVDEALETFSLTRHADAPAHDLSGGQKQLLALTSVLVGEPNLVIADEPTALLDAVNTRIISNFLLDKMTQQLVLVTHDMRLAERCDMAVRFDNQRITAVGPAQEIARKYQEEFA